MIRALRLTLFAAIPIALLVVLPIAVYGIDRGMASGKVARNVSVAGVDVGGASPEEAAALIEEYEKQLQTTTATFVVEGAEFELDPLTVALAADVDGAVDYALSQRSYAFVAGFIPWVTSFNDSIDLDLNWSLDAGAVDEQLIEWERQAISKPAYEGAVALVDGEIVVEYPAVGIAIDRSKAPTLIARELASPMRTRVELPLTEAQPDLSVTDIDEAVATIERMLSRPAVLTDVGRGVKFVLDHDQLAEAVRIDITTSSDAAIELSLSQEVVSRYLDLQREQLEIPPFDVSYEVDEATNTVSVVPSRVGGTVDPAAASAALLEAATTGFSKPIPYMEGEKPRYSTEDAEAWGPLGLVSEFTTTMPGVNRVFNIQLMADTIDGYIVFPGEEFSINDFVGERTEEGGYKRDGAIIGGEVICCEEPANVGGGVSQYGTTFYNAIFFGCYEELDHTPHSLYISRYPEGREATLGFPAPDVRFRNDTDVPVIIDNSYTNSTITVKFFGNNGGRVCTAEKSERFAPTSPRIVYEPNPDIAPGTEHVASKGSGGFSVTVTRVMTMPDGRVIRQPYTHRYRGSIRKIEKNPCDLSSDVECPVQVPGVVGLDVGSATAALDAAGFRWAFTYVDSPKNVGKVIKAIPGGLQPPGTTITLTVGQ